MKGHETLKAYPRWVEVNAATASWRAMAVREAGGRARTNHYAHTETDFAERFKARRFTPTKMARPRSLDAQGVGWRGQPPGHLHLSRTWRSENLAYAYLEGQGPSAASARSDDVEYRSWRLATPVARLLIGSTTKQIAGGIQRQPVGRAEPGPLREHQCASTSDVSRRPSSKTRKRWAARKPVSQATTDAVPLGSFARQEPTYQALFRTQRA